MKIKPQYITPKSLLKILNLASRNTQLGKVTKLYVERQQIKEATAKLKERRKKNAEELRTLTAINKPEQFLFKF